jgi:hypothetical protein
LSSVSLAAGASQSINVQIPSGTLAPGAYEGFIDVTPVGGSTAQARIPWMYTVPAAIATHIIFDVNDGPPLVVAAGSSGYLDVRFVDDSGVPLYPPGYIYIVQLSGIAAASFGGNEGDGCDNTITKYGCFNTNGVYFPNVYYINVSVPANDFSGDTSVFRVYSGKLYADFTVVTQ